MFEQIIWMLMCLFCLNRFIFWVIVFPEKWKEMEVYGTIAVITTGVILVCLPLAPQPRLDSFSFLWRIVGIIVFIFGIIIMMRNYREFHKKGIGPDRIPTKLAATGIYGVVRHPLYLGLNISFAGWSLIWVAIYYFYLIPVIIYFSIIFLAGIMTYSMYMGFPYLPVRSGFAKVVLSELSFLLAITSFTVLMTRRPLGLPHLMVMSVVVAAVISVDFNGNSPIYKSNLGELFYHHGHKRMLFLTGVYRLNPYGSIQLDEDKCSGCAMCYQVCLKDVYQIDFNSHKAKIVQVEDCVNCGACVWLCPEQCLVIV